MHKTGWIILGGIFVIMFGAAAALMALMLGGEVEPPAPRPDEPALERPAPDAQPEPDRPVMPRLREEPTDASMARRLDALESEVERLRRELAAERAKADERQPARPPR